MSEMIKLSTICKIKGGTGFPEKYQGNKSAEFPVVKVSEMEIEGNKKYIKVANNYLDQKTAILLNATIFPKDTIVFAKVGAALLLNRRRILSRESILDNNMMGLIVASEVNVNFLYQFLLTFDLGMLVQTGALPSVNQQIVGNIEIPFPPLPQQRKIAKILTSVDNLIEKTEALIAKYQSIKQGMMHDLFTRGVDSNGKLRPAQSAAPELYKQSELGWIPKEWEVGKIGDIACLIGGFAFSSTLVRNSGVRWMKISNVGFEEIVWDESSYLPERLLKEQHDFVLKRGDIVMAMTRPIIRGKLKIAFVQKHDTPSLLNQRVGKFVIHNLDDNYFAYFAVQFSETVQQLEFKMLGTDPPNLSSSHIESVKLPLPSQSERKMQGEIIAVIDRKIKKERQSLNFYLSIKTALMQDLLSGKVQVTPDEIDKETAQLNAYLKELGV